MDVQDGKVDSGEGGAIAMSGDGRRLVVTTWYYPCVGAVRIYEDVGQWNQIGTDLRSYVYVGGGFLVSVAKGRLTSTCIQSKKVFRKRFP